MKKVRMTCILKSGAKIEDTLKVDPKNSAHCRAIKGLCEGIETSIGYKEPKLTNITFGATTIAVSEIAAIQFKEV